jgi:hypothetical protein
MLPAKFVPQCLICTSRYREKIEEMIVMGYSASAIEREFAETEDPAPRRSVSNHGKYHLDYKKDAIRKTLEKTALEAAINVEETAHRIVTRQGYLQEVINKGFEGLVNDPVAPSARDVMKAIELQGQFAATTAQGQADRVERQYRAIVQAIKIVVPQGVWSEVIAKAEEIFDADENEPISSDVTVIGEGDSGESPEVPIVRDEPRVFPSVGR